MERILIDRLLKDIPNLKFHKIERGIIPNGIWFDLEVKPLPPYEDLKKVTYDVDKDNILHITENLNLTHSSLCTEEYHALDAKLASILEKIEDMTYKVAIWEGSNQISNKQPIVISLDPEVSFNIYPDHPHINAGGSFGKKYIPNSICYTDDPNSLGEDNYTRILEAIHQTSIWLFKHQIWLASRKLGKGIWIGPQVYINETEQFTYYRNPYGKCRCGSNKLYFKCHLNKDFKNYCVNESILLNEKNKVSNLFRKPDGTIEIEKYKTFWESQINYPQSLVLFQLRKQLSFR